MNAPIIDEAGGVFVDPKSYADEPRPLLATAEADDMAHQGLDAGMGLRTLIHMDDPQHRVVRAIGADWFRPKAMWALKVRVDELTKIYVDKMLAAGAECDFVQEVAVNYPLYVIMSLAGAAGVGLSPHARADPGGVRRRRRRN